MAYSFPVAFRDFFPGLRFLSAVPNLTEANEISRTRGGELMVDELGVRLWTVDLVLASHDQRQGRALAAKLNVLRRSTASVLVGCFDGDFPAADPSGAILGASVPTIGSVAANNLELSLQGLPAGYALTEGDYLSFVDGGVRHFHQLVSGGVAGAGGVTPLLEVEPHLPLALSPGLAVKLVRPEFKARILPGSFKPGGVGPGRIYGPKFTLVQDMKSDA